MKLNRLETHDRLLHLKKDQSVNIYKGAEDCLKRNPLSLALQEKAPYIYIFAHPRSTDDGLNKRLLWQPRLSIPQAQTNSYLFRAISKTDMIEVCWIIPDRPMWDQYKKGNVTEDNLALWSINMFQNNRKELERAHPEDLTEEQGRIILKKVIDEHRESLRIKSLYPKQATSGLFPPSLG